MSRVYVLHQPFNPAALQVRLTPQPMGWKPMSPLEDYGDMAGFGSFFKKVAQTVSKVALAPIKLVSPQLAKNLSKIDNKIINNIDSVQTKIDTAAKNAMKSVGRFVKKNWKWIVVAAAIAITIYTMGSGAGIAAKMMSGLAKVKAYAVSAKAWVGAKASSGWSYVTSGMTKLLNGKKFGDLNQQEVEGIAEANEQAGQSIIPAEVLAMIGRQALTPAEQVQAQVDLSSFGPGQGAGGGAGLGLGGSDSNPWLMPALIGAGALVLVLAVA